VSSLLSDNLGEVLMRAAGLYGDRPALLYAGDSVSFAELDRRASAMSAALAAAGVVAGDRVAISLPNVPSFASAYFGVLRAGAVAVPLNVLLRDREVSERLEVVVPRVLVTDAQRESELSTAAEELGVQLLVLDEHAAGLPQAAFAAVARKREDPAVILFTSGTSGTSKGAVLTHGGIAAAATNAAKALGYGPGDVILGVAPFSHVLGQSSGLVASCLTGAAIAVIPRFDPDGTLAEMTATKTTVLLGVPTMCIALCEAAKTADELPPVRLAHVGGAAVPVEVGREFERVFGAPVYEGYGLTELSGIATTYELGQATRPGSVGKTLGGTELRIVGDDGVAVAAGEVGEVQFHGPSVVTAYWHDGGPNTAALADGWLATGDLGRLDDDGFLYLVDRKKELVLRGGYNIYPREVEEVLYEHPDVLEVAVIGIPHQSLGEEVVALVTLRPGGSTDEDELREWGRTRLAAYKYPRHVVVVESLPKGPTGKILKRAIDRDAIAAELTAGSHA
jgi:long-chain acyl-CoA synthetase